ncbi:ATP-binding protein [Microbacterium sp. P5_E9]
MLVERESLLGELAVALDTALGGRGRLVFLGGEAGVGKSALVRAFGESVVAPAKVRVGGVDNLTTADALAAFQDAVPEIVPRLEAGGERIRLFRALRSTLIASPGLLILEDLHWADEATLDALRFLARRLDGVPVLIIATYRSDEARARHPLTLLMGDLTTVASVRRLMVPPLTVDGVALLAEQAGVAVDAAMLHARTDGNPFFVTESLAVGGEDLPETVSDAVLARVARLSPGGQDAAAAAAILGTVADAALLSAVAGRDVAALDECVEAGVLVPTGDGFGFRHELARDAVERSLSAARRSELHRRALGALTARTPEDSRTLSHHAAGCGDDAAAAYHARLAGERAARLNAHREAAAHYRMALRHGSAASDRPALFVALSYECYLTDQLPEALTARQRALELHELAGDAALVGDDERWLSRVSWFLGRGPDSERYAARAIASLEPLGPSRALAMAYSNFAQLRMLASDDAEAVLWARRALALAIEFGDVEIESHALNNLGVVTMTSGSIPEGEALLARSLDLALAADLSEHAARAYTNLASEAVAEHRYSAGLVHLDAGIAYCEDRDLDSWARYMRAWRCVALGDIGRFDDALADALLLLDHPDIAPVSAIPAAAAAGRVLARRGEEASAFLSHATELAAGTREIQRIAPAACAAAEDAWLRGTTGTIGPLTDAAWTLALAHSDPWAVGELAWWRMLGGCERETDLPLAEPFRLALEGSPLAAADAWDALGSPVWSAYACGLAPDAASADRAVRVLDALGAAQSVQAVLRTRRELGLPLPRRPRTAARTQPGQLTARELEVLGLLDRGLSTAEIAATLIVSPRTVDHHIAAVLRKLGEPTRARAVAAARLLGLLDR